MIKQPSPKDKKIFQQALHALDSGKSEKAIKLFNKVRKSWCDNADIFYLQGLAYGKLGRNAEVKSISMRALKLEPDHFGAMCNLANALISMGKSDVAISYYEKALKIKPDAAEILDNYGRALSIIGRRDESIKVFEKSLNINGGYAPIYAALGKVYAESGQIKRAKQEFKKALKLDDNLAEAHVGQGILDSGEGLLEEAEWHFNRAAELDKYNIAAYVGLANVKRYQADFLQALNYLDEAEKLQMHEDSDLLSLRSHILEQKGDKDAAYEIVKTLIEHDNVPSQAVSVFASISLNYNRAEEAISLIDKTLGRIDVVSSDKQALLYSAGSLSDKIERYDEAMKYYHQANSVIDISCDREAYNKQYSEIVQYFSSEKVSKYPVSNIDSDKPVFIVGMPRSGTTLTEQILASHKDVFGAGELHFIKEINYQIQQKYTDYSDFFAHANSGTLNNLASQYLKKINQLNNEARHLVDKMPHNFMYLGLITLLFPKAKIIHCRRHPLDNALSIYFQSFIWSHDYASDLADIGFFYNLYDRVMKHWESVIDTQILTVQYEDMIDNQEFMSRKILEFCNLDWDKSVLDFHKNDRNVGTASYDQVRQPIYTTSKKRWKNYENFIQPVFNELPEYLKKMIVL